jgi:hypothetical protein
MLLADMQVILVARGGCVKQRIELPGGGTQAEKAAAQLEPRPLPDIVTQITTCPDL